MTASTPPHDRHEHDYLERYDPNEFDRPSVAVDVALLGLRERELVVGLIAREEHPARGRWALPGGFVRIDESLDAAAARVLDSKAALRRVFVEQLYTFGEPRRDPRTRVISVAYYALVSTERLTGIDAGALTFGRLSVPWRGEEGGPVSALDESGGALALAFDHGDIISMAVKRIRGKLHYTAIGYQLLPERFTLRELQDVHETILGTSLNKDSFRRRMLASGDIEATGERESAVLHRPAELYRFTRRSAV